MKRIGRALPSCCVEPPGPNSRRLAKDLAKFESPGISIIATGDIPIFWKRASAANVEDVDGNLYIDMTSAFGVASIGHTHPKVVKAIEEQSKQLVHGMGDIYPHPLRAQLAQKLAKITPGKLQKCMWGNTGAEAVELALKTAVRYTGKPGIIAFQGAFHGQSYGALQVTSRRLFRDPFSASISQNVVHVPYPYTYRSPLSQELASCAEAHLQYIKHLLDDPASAIPPIGAILVEPVQGREGEIVPPSEFLPGLRSICDERGLLLIADEVMTGFGRTGEWFAVDHWGVQPDIMCLGKALGGGAPISACIATERIMDAWSYSSGEPPHSSTFMGNPVSCAAALATIQVIEEEGLVERGKELGAYLKERLLRLQKRHPIVGEVRGLGMMIGVELVKDRQTKEPAPREMMAVIKGALKRGVILLPGGTHGNVISIEPPLVITKRQLDYAVDVIDGCLAKSLDS